MPFKANVKVNVISILLRLIRNKLKKILKLDVNKVSQSSDIPIKVLKENSNIFSNFLCNSFNDSIKLLTFPEILKHADITPLYKKGKKDIKGNYRPVSILPNLSKIFQKCMFEQISQFFENIFSKYQCGFRKVLSSGNVRKMGKVC